MTWIQRSLHARSLEGIHGWADANSESPASRQGTRGRRTGAQKRKDIPVTICSRRMDALAPCRGAGCSASLRAWQRAQVTPPRAAPAPPVAPHRCALGALVHRRRHSRRHEPGACASDGGHSQPAAAPSPPPPATLRSPFLTQSPPQAPVSVSPPVASWSAINGPLATGGAQAGGAARGSGSGNAHKAELYLVRTDGFTCTRETVTGALPWVGGVPAGRRERVRAPAQ